MSIFDGMNGSGMLFPVDAAMDDEQSRRSRNKMRRFFIGGPLGSPYPLGMFPLDSYDDVDEDPNP